MDKDKEPGMVSLQSIFEELERIERVIQRNPKDLKSDQMKRGVSILKEIKNELAPLAEEKETVELELIMEDINLALDVLTDNGEASKALEALESAKVNLTQYNLRSRKDIES